MDVPLNQKIYVIYSEVYMQRLVVIRCSNSHQVRKEVKSFVHNFTALAQILFRWTIIIKQKDFDFRQTTNDS